MPKTFDQYRDDIAADSHTETQNVDSAASDGGYASLKVDELRELADQRGIDHAGLKKAEIIDALEAAGA